MKKITLILAFVLLLGSVVFVSCGTESKNEVAVSSNATQERTKSEAISIAKKRFEEKIKANNNTAGSKRIYDIRYDKELTVKESSDGKYWDVWVSGDYYVSGEREKRFSELYSIRKKQ